jgi:hypothetical protein
MGLLGDVVGAVAKLGPLAYKTVAKIKDRYEPIVRPDPSDPLLCWLVGSINSYRLVKDLIWFTLLCVPLSCILACVVSRKVMPPIVSKSRAAFVD